MPRLAKIWRWNGLVPVIALLLLAPLPPKAPAEPKLVLAGGGTTSKQMVQRFIELCGGGSKRILVVSLTRERPVESGKDSADFLKENGATDVFVVDDARAPNLEQLFEKAHGVYIPGGDQTLLMDRLGEPRARRLMQLATQNGAAFFGTSAGAMLASETMITGDGRGEGSARLGIGLGLTPVMIDSHFRERNRESRLRDGFLSSAAPMAIGLDRNEWIVLQGTTVLEKHGNPFILKR